LFRLFSELFARSFLPSLIPAFLSSFLPSFSRTPSLLFLLPSSSSSNFRSIVWSGIDEEGVWREREPSLPLSVSLPADVFFLVGSFLFFVCLKEDNTDRQADRQGGSYSLALLFPCCASLFSFGAFFLCLFSPPQHALPRYLIFSYLVILSSILSSPLVTFGITGGLQSSYLHSPNHFCLPTRLCSILPFSASSRPDRDRERLSAKHDDTQTCQPCNATASSQNASSQETHGTAVG